MASGIYNSFKRDVLKGLVNLVSDTIQCALMTASHTFNAAAGTNSIWSQVSGNEVASGNGYTTGGATLSGNSVTANDTNNQGVFAASNVSWTSSSITARYAVLYDATQSNPNKPLICCFDFGSALTSVSATFQIVWNASGIMLLS
jgi:hypothetical protein